MNYCTIRRSIAIAHTIGTHCTIVQLLEVRKIVLQYWYKSMKHLTITVDKIINK